MNGSPSGSVQPPEENAPAQADLAHTQAERGAPPGEQERIKSPRRHRIRRSIVGVLVAFCCLLVLLSATVVWAHRTLLNTGAFVKLATAQRLVKAFDRLTLVLPLVTIALLALTLWLSVNRRRTVLQLAVGVSLLMIVDRRVVIHEQGTLASSAHNPQVAQSLLGQLLNGFFVLTAWVLGVALAVLVITVLMGPYRWAVATRSSVKRTWRSISQAGSGNHRGAVGWLASHAAGFQLAGAVVAGILLLTVSVSWLSFLIIGVLLAAYEVYLQWIKPPPPDEAPTAGPGNQAGVPSRTSGT